MKYKTIPQDVDIELTDARYPLVHFADKCVAHIPACVAKRLFKPKEEPMKVKRKLKAGLEFEVEPRGSHGDTSTVHIVGHSVAVCNELIDALFEPPEPVTEGEVIVPFPVALAYMEKGGRAKQVGLPGTYCIKDGYVVICCSSPAPSWMTLASAFRVPWILLPQDGGDQ